MHVRMYTCMLMHRVTRRACYGILYTCGACAVHMAHVTGAYATICHHMPPYATTCHRMLPYDSRHGSATAEQSP